MEEEVAVLVEDLLMDETSSREELAATLRVSTSAVSRWRSGESRPRPHIERQLRELCSAVRESRARYAVKDKIQLSLGAEASIRSALDRALHQLREIFHRRSRVSGRSEALDEISKLLFAHVLGIANDGKGIDRSLLTDDSLAPAALRAFVSRSVASYLPETLAHELREEDFELRLLPQEQAIAEEIILCFDQLGRQPGLVGPDGIEAVDLLNEVFGKFLADSFTDEKQLGQYLTPTEVVRFMVQLAIEEFTEEEISTVLDPERIHEFGHILDPSCGVASFLAEFVRTLHGRLSEPTIEEAWLNRLLREVIVGVDKSERMLRYAVTNLAMFGIPAAHLQLANAISKRGQDGMEMAKLDGKVGLILTNPPFGAEFDQADTAHFRIGNANVSSRSKLPSECLFLERYLDWLRPGGQLLAIVPDSILTNQGAFAALRAQLSKSIEIRNIISLPSITFAASGTTTKTSILHLRKLPCTDQPVGRNSVVSICSDIGYSISMRGSHRVKETRSAGQLPEILKAITGGHRESSFSRQVPGLEMCSRWDASFHASMPKELEARIRNLGDAALRVRDIAELVHSKRDPRRDPGDFDYIEISDVESTTRSCRSKRIRTIDAPSRARKLVRAGDVLFSTVRPERGSIGVVPRHLDGAICTTGFAVLRPLMVPPKILAVLLASEVATAQVMRHNVGIAYPAIDEKCIMDIVLPITFERIEALKEAASKLDNIESAHYEARLELAERLGNEIKHWGRPPMAGPTHY